MRIDFDKIDEITVPGMNNGTGTMSARLYRDSSYKIIPSRIHKYGSIGLHSHPTSDDISYVLEGEGIAVCDGIEEKLHKGVCHICPKGSSHSIANTGEEDLVLLTVVVER